MTGNEGGVKTLWCEGVLGVCIHGDHHERGWARQVCLKEEQIHIQQPKLISLVWGHKHCGCDNGGNMLPKQEAFEGFHSVEHGVL